MSHRSPRASRLVFIPKLATTLKSYDRRRRGGVGDQRSFFFGAAETFKDTIARVAGKPKVLIIRLRRTPAMDATGLHALTDVVRRSRREGTLVLLAEVQPQPMATLRRSVLIDEIGQENLCASMEEAPARARGVGGQAPARRWRLKERGRSVARFVRYVPSVQFMWHRLTLSVYSVNHHLL